ncbi:esterase/lipase family protein [Nocardia stercoris]|uniref:Triacylglycerol lipase n=1 Tax=Nocardia stercoris TaxID=2483361 RepID=A0A3M2LDM5_9NOCA|nr:alpha/beta fold hydrolase [Nocardia stercoris]RMI35639.1 triacylglycerol lipase [Nocardia stercoris]
MFGRNTTVLTATAAAAIGGWAPAAADTAPLPVPYGPAASYAHVADATTPPPGANLAGCAGPAPHPHPVILINGMYLTQGAAWNTGAPLLHNAGYCVFTFNYGNPVPLAQFPLQQLTDLRAAARELATEVDRVRIETNSDTVDLVGYSQGGVLAQYYINVLGGNTKVDKLIGIVAENHGMTAGPLPAPLDRAIPPMTQLRRGSDFLNEIYADGDTRPGADYTVIASSTDPVTAPYEHTFLDGPGVTNVLLQQDCDLDHSDHESALYSPRVWQYVLDALQPDAASPVPCVEVAPASS